VGYGDDSRDEIGVFSAVSTRFGGNGHILNLRLMFNIIQQIQSDTDTYK